jgi:hypothetical protein
MALTADAVRAIFVMLFSSFTKKFLELAGILIHNVEYQCIETNKGTRAKGKGGRG